MLVRRAGDVGVWAAGRAGEEPDLLESVLQAGPGEDRRAEQAFDEHACGVVGEHGDRIRPQRWFAVITRDVTIVEPLNERIAGIELVDADPAFELVEPHQIEHEGGRHDARRVPAELVEGVAQQTLGREHPVTHVHERIRLDAPKVVEVGREVVRCLAHGLDRGDGHTAPAALLAEVAEVLLAVG